MMEGAVGRVEGGCCLELRRLCFLVAPSLCHPRYLPGSKQSRGNGGPAAEKHYQPRPGG